MNSIKPWHIFVLLAAFGMPFLLQISMYPMVPFQMFSQTQPVHSNRLKLLGFTHLWQDIVPEASFGQTEEWAFMLKKYSLDRPENFLKNFAATKQGQRYQSLRFIRLSTPGDTTTLAQWPEK